jgi:hypothetical protein
MSSLNFLQNYKSDNEDGSSSSSEEEKTSDNIKSILSKFEINAAPVVLYSVSFCSSFVLND